MRVAFFLNDFPSLSQTFILNQITGIIDLGGEVDLYAFRKKSPDAIHEIVYQYELLEKVSYLHALPSGRKTRLASFIKLITSKNILKCMQPFIKGMNVFKYGRASRSLQLPADIVQISQPRSYDVIHCQFGTIANRVLNLIETGILSGKLVTSFRGYDATRYVLENPGIYDRLFKRGDYFLPVSHSLRKTIEKLGCPEDRIMVVHSGIQLDQFKYAAIKHPDNGPVKVITVARLVEKKGIEFSIKAVAHAISEGVDIHYSIVGDGELLGNLQAIAADNNIEDKVTFLGWKTHNEVMSLLTSSHILLAPSITAENGDQEGIPNVMKEAMAIGLPVIGTLHGGTPELVEHEKTGFLVAEKDSDAMARYLKYLCEHPDIWEKIGLAARHFIEKEFDSQALNNKLLGVYQKLSNEGS